MSLVNRVLRTGYNCILTKTPSPLARNVLRPVYYGQERSIGYTGPPSLTYQAPEDKNRYPVPKTWALKNYEIYPPQEADEERRRANFCHFRDNIKYSPKKMWYICCLIRGLSVDEAIKQLSFVPKKGAVIAKEVLEEARDLALKEHHFEYKSNMWVAEALATKGLVIKGFRKHARFRFGEVRYFHTHLCLQLVEGPPPPYYYHEPLTNKMKLDRYVDDLRKRNLKFTL
ncbi:39S ribosomal protein L22, mitochondrial [Halotydeus destructor]|nr:39S ribosomal protein L22, mitochondrial [Halotydeus destructor]